MAAMSAARWFLGVSAAVALAGCAHGSRVVDSDWPIYGGNAMGQRHSALSQINRDTVGGLEQAWRFEAGTQGGLQTSPIVIGRMLYGYTTDQHAFALDGATGELVWRFDPGQASGQPARSMAYWSDENEARLFVSNVTSLYALNPDTGMPITSFGDGGRIDLRNNLGRNPDESAVFPTSPGIVFDDLIIVGFRTSENPPAPPGDIRAYDVRTGALRWTFHTIPHPGEPGHESWPSDAWRTAGGANNWAGMALDENRGIVYVPTGSAVFDFYGADRLGNNLYANSLVALDARTGQRIWHFQAVHHDLWDRDFASPPTLVTVRHNGRMVDAVAQPSKQGYLYLLDRVTGEPLFPIEERAVPQSDVPGEQTAPTQPFPSVPAPYARQLLTEDMIAGQTPEDQAAMLARFRDMRSEGQFTPLSTQQDTIVFPGFDGGAEWGGAAVDPQSGVAFINANDVPYYTRLVPLPPASDTSVGEQVYQRNCASCHGQDRTGSPPTIPSLVGVGSRLFPHEIANVITNGRGRMPGFPQLGATALSAVRSYVMTNGGALAASGERAEVSSPGASPSRMPYINAGYNRFVDAEGYPAVVPPWGTLNAIDLNTGEYLWTIPLGEYPELAARGIAPTGSENYGGPIVTDGGLVFIGATIFDRQFRAFDSRTGTLLWQRELPFSGAATPATYSVDGRQYVVIATSGARNPAGPQGAAYVAYALPVAN